MNKNSNNKLSKHNKPETTGHSWDGIEEYNTPAPRWWLIVWLVCIIWSVIYWLFYPAWPIAGGNTKGISDWTSKSQLKENQIVIKQKKDVYLQRFNKASFDEILQDKELMAFALNGGKSAFQNNCAACHGTGAAGGKGFPNLNDDDWIWGGKIEDIYTTLIYGIRSGNDQAKNSVMPSFGLDKILTKTEIEQVADYVMSFSGSDNQEKTLAGEKIFKNNCAACHGENGKGGREVGAPNLTDRIWLYGASKQDIIHSIVYSRAGVMPYWSSRLDDDTIRQLTIYVHSLGGGE
jgi:cytochrome c oxidase cbb3-type subunit 3